MSMDAKTFFTVACSLPVDQSVLIRGDHGIGKSEIVKQLAKHFNLPLIDIRLSQREAGDVIGLPLLEGGVTKFCPPDWVMRACTEPVVLFLDELNRATPEVQQAVFELVLDRRMQGNKLHEGTRVFSAVNLSQKYQTNEMDPALLDRFFVIDFDPTADDWFDFAKKSGVNQDLISFLRDRPGRLDPKPGEDSAAVTASRRSWVKFDSAAKAAGLYDTSLSEDQSAKSLMFQMANGFVGSAISSQLIEWMIRTTEFVKPEEIMNNYEKVRDRVLKSSIDRLNDMIDRLLVIGNKKVFNEVQVKNIEDFVVDLPHELRFTFMVAMLNTNFNGTEEGTANLKALNRARKAVVDSYRDGKYTDEALTQINEARQKRQEAAAAKAAADAANVTAESDEAAVTTKGRKKKTA